MMRSKFLHFMTALVALPMSACRLFLAPATRPLRKLKFEPQGNKAQELVLLLPGRLSRPEEFVQFGIVDLIQQERPLARIVAPDLHLGYYMRGLADACLHEEIIGPAKKQGLRVTIIGVSMGGLGALTYSLRFPAEVDEMFLLSPFVGEKELLAEIEQAGGLEKWESEVGTPRSKTEALQKMWIEIKRQWLSRSGPPFPIALAVGKSDRLLASNQFFARSILKPDQLIEIEGEHDWACWKQGTAILLSKSKG
jgi:pimeloyl-ACP methyl ester carboxylesterase